jgi:rare lipoprotein A
MQVAYLSRLALVALAGASLAACASVESQPPGQSSIGAMPQSGSDGPHANAGPSRAGPPYQVNGVWYVPREQPDYDEVGFASWYGDAFHGRSTADGEVFDMNAVSGAHTTLPLPSIVEVTNLDNGRQLRVRVNDRGPFVGDRIIDLSHEAARQLGYDRKGLARVRVRYVGPAPLLGPEAGVRMARAGSSAPAVRLASAARSRPKPASAAAAPSDEVVLTGAPAPARRLQIVVAMPSARQAGPIYRIQVGAFSEEARAWRAVGKIADLGAAVVEPIQRNGATLFRVTLPGPADQQQAYNLRERVARAGFADARVIGPS